MINCGGGDNIQIVPDWVLISWLLAQDSDCCVTIVIVDNRAEHIWTTTWQNTRKYDTGCGCEGS